MFYEISEFECNDALMKCWTSILTWGSEYCLKPSQKPNCSRREETGYLLSTCDKLKTVKKDSQISTEVVAIIFARTSQLLLTDIPINHPRPQWVRRAFRLESKVEINKTKRKKKLNR